MAHIVSEFEGTLLKNSDFFSYFMLVAFEASGLIRFALLLSLWPVICLLEAMGRQDEGLKLAIFVATAGLPLSEIESVARAVLPKFYMDDVDVEAWRGFSSYDKRVVVTQMPRVMVEMFAIEHLRADGVVGSELSTNQFGLATGFVREDFGSIAKGVARVCGDEETWVGLGRSKSRCGSFFLPLCKERVHSAFNPSTNPDAAAARLPHPVIFHDGRLARCPTPFTALLILLWIPLGSLLALARISVGLFLPIRASRAAAAILGCDVTVLGTPPRPFSGQRKGGILYVCTHRTLMDPVVLSSVLGRRIPAVTYSISRLSEILSPIPTVRLERARDADGRRIKRQLEKGDLALCPEGTTCRDPFLLRFSALFAELTDRIVPVAMNCRAGLFYATTARGWKAMDPVFFFMNPRPAYEVTFLKQLPAEATCAAGRSPHEVANQVQRMLAATLGFECTNLTRKDKYRALAGNDGIVLPASGSFTVKEFVDGLKKVVAGGFYDSLWLKV